MHNFPLSVYTRANMYIYNGKLASLSNSEHDMNEYFKHIELNNFVPGYCHILIVQPITMIKDTLLVTVNLRFFLYMIKF